MKNTLLRRSVQALALACGCLYAGAVSAQNDNLVLHYNRPAEYFEEALVIGNGTMGAIIYGGTQRDVLSLNDLTLWTGEPDREVTTPDAYRAIPVIRELLDNEDYRGADREQRKVQGHYSENYQPLGQLTVTYLDEPAEITAYRRSLDIGNATARTQYLRGGKAQACDYFASAPDSVIVLRLTSAGEKGIRALLSFTSQLPHATSAAGNEMAVEGYAAYHSYPSYYKGVKEKHLYDPERGTRFRTLVRVLTQGGSVKSFPSGELKIEGAREALVLVANVTSFNGFDKDPAREGRDYRGLVERRMERAAAKTYDELRAAHVADYKHYFDRVKLDLGQTAPEIAALPTDEQLKLYTDKQQANPALEALYFQFGRYLLISSSRTPGVPANLQGLWNERILPPWSCNYTTNINLEENYWAAETANLSEMHRPLMDFIANLSRTGAETAKAYYGVDKGWCLGQNTDIWAMTCPVGLNVGDPVGLLDDGRRMALHPHLGALPVHARQGVPQAILPCPEGGGRVLPRLARGEGRQADDLARHFAREQVRDARRLCGRHLLRLYVRPGHDARMSDGRRQGRRHAEDRQGLPEAGGADADPPFALSRGSRRQPAGVVSRLEGSGSATPPSVASVRPLSGSSPLCSGHARPGQGMRPHAGNQG